MMDEKILERMLNNLIEEAGPIAIQNMEIESSKEDVPDVKFSKKHEEKMKELFDEVKRNDRNKYNIHDSAESNDNDIKDDKIISMHKFTFLKKVAVFLVATIAISGITVTSVSGWRESFMKIFLDDKEEYSDVIDEKRGSEVCVDNVCFGYIPDGFELGEKKQSSNINIISFKNGEEYFVLKIRNEIWNNKVNTESGEKTDIMINGKEMVYHKNENLNSLTWNENDIICYLYSNCNKSMLEEIAKEIKIIN